MDDLRNCSLIWICAPGWQKKSFMLLLLLLLFIHFSRTQSRFVFEASGRIQGQDSVCSDIYKETLTCWMFKNCKNDFHRRENRKGRRRGQGGGTSRRRRRRVVGWQCWIKCFYLSLEKLRPWIETRFIAIHFWNFSITNKNKSPRWKVDSEFKYNRNCWIKTHLLLFNQ